MDDLLIKYILEEATPAESDQVQQWLAADAANRSHFEKLQAVWQLAAQHNLQPATNTQQALHRLKQTLQARETAPRARGIKRIRPHVWIAAATVAGIVGVALGAYVWIKPKAPVKEQRPIVQPDTLLQKPVKVDTTPTVQSVPALHTDTIPSGKPHKKKLPKPVTPVQPARKKKTAEQPMHPTDTTHVKKKHPQPVQHVSPLRKHKSAGTSTAPQALAKEPPIS
jgi:hypothetical protein